MNIKRKSLTVEELKNMDGEIVQIINAIENTVETGIVRSNRCFVSGNDNIRYFFDSVGKGFYVYPVVNKEMWKSCDMCKTCRNCLNLIEDILDNPYESPCNSCFEYSKFSPVPYCYNCGRPLTDEAWKELWKRLNG